VFVRCLLYPKFMVKNRFEMIFSARLKIPSQ
jgi:hypothetical protein